MKKVTDEGGGGPEAVLTGYPSLQFSTCNDPSLAAVQTPPGVLASRALLTK
jgi:hypothetical protein